MWEHQSIMLEIHWAKTLDLSNQPINFIYHRGIVSCLPSHHVQTLPWSTTMPHSTRHRDYTQPLVQLEDIGVSVDCGKRMISANEDLLDLKYSFLSNSPDMRRHLRMHFECLKHSLDTIQSFSLHLLPLLHWWNLRVHLGDPPSAFPPYDISQLWNCARHMLQKLPNCPHYRIFPRVRTMQIRRAIIRQCWVVPKAKAQTVWSKQNSYSRNLPTG